MLYVEYPKAYCSFTQVLQSDIMIVLLHLATAVFFDTISNFFGC